MKLAIFTLTLLLTTSLQAQTKTPAADSDARSRAIPENAHQRTANFNQQLAMKEAALRQQVGRYHTAQDLGKIEIQLEVERLLFDLFDLGLKRKAAEAQELDAQLVAMEADSAFQNRAQEIQQLKDRLRKVKSTLTFRQANRERIVRKRMGELLLADP